MASLDIQVQDKKTDGVINSNVINLKFKGQDGRVVKFRVKKTIHLGKLMSLYCQQKSLDIKALSFLYDGRYIKLKNTPAQLEMEDGDKIDAMLHQTVAMNRPTHVNLKVKGLDGTEVSYRVKRNLPLGELLNTYCERQSLEFKTVVFLSKNGKRIRKGQTPAQLRMKDGYEIHAMLHQGGGGPKGLKFRQF